MSSAIYKPSPHKRGREHHDVRLIVIHGDAGKSDVGTISWLQKADLEKPVSYHYLVGRDGKVYQFVHEGDVAWHAGVSKWPNCNVGNTVNPHSIGVAFANDGTGAEAYRDVQYERGVELVADICSRYRLRIAQVVGHHQVSPGRKTDPWDWFDWDRFRKLLAAKGIAA